MKIVFLAPGWEDYLFWQQYDQKILMKINSLLKEIKQTPFKGTGKPEALKHNLSGWWSSRINLEHRLVYRVDKKSIVVLQCRYHYELWISRMYRVWRCAPLAKLQYEVALDFSIL